MSQTLLLAQPPSYRAPWSPLLRIVSIGATILCLGIGGVQLSQLSGGAPAAVWISLAILLLIPGAALFTVRGYRFEASTLLIERLLWSTRVPLDGLLSAAVEENGMCGSIRTCGNGGFYSFTGWYWSRRLGAYRAYVTDQRRPVVLRLAQRTILVSPERPEEFAAEAVRAARGG
jgi:hypothetical protein